MFAPKLGFPVSSKTKDSCLARKLENHYSKRLPCSLRELRLRALLRKATSPLLPKTEIPCVNFSFRSPVRLKDWILMPAFFAFQRYALFMQLQNCLFSSSSLLTPADSPWWLINTACLSILSSVRQFTQALTTAPDRTERKN